METASIGGAAHLVNFCGSDTMPGEKLTGTLGHGDVGNDNNNYYYYNNNNKNNNTNTNSSSSNSNSNNNNILYKCIVLYSFFTAVQSRYIYIYSSDCISLILCENDRACLYTCIYILYSNRI